MSCFISVLEFEEFSIGTLEVKSLRQLTHVHEVHSPDAGDDATVPVLVLGEQHSHHLPHGQQRLRNLVLVATAAPIKPKNNQSRQSACSLTPACLTTHWTLFWHIEHYSLKQVSILSLRILLIKEWTCLLYTLDDAAAPWYSTHVLYMSRGGTVFAIKTTPSLWNWQGQSLINPYTMI